MISARKLLKSMSIKQGTKYDSPESARDIPGFIQFHNLNMDEILDPLPSFSTWFPSLRSAEGLRVHPL
jgi:phosphatidylserine decarboxylase